MFNKAVEVNPQIAVVLQQIDSWTQYTNRVNTPMGRIWAVVAKELFEGKISPEQAAKSMHDQILAVW
jgi:hypothetical protein